MTRPGIPATQLIKLLKEQVKLHGDLEVWAGGGDYPQGVQGLRFDPKGDTYHPANCFRIG